MSVPERERALARALEQVCEAVHGAPEGVKVKLERAIRRAAGEELEDRAVEMAGNAAGVAPGGLDDWAAFVGNRKAANTMGAAAMKAKWRADLAERPDDLKDILGDRLERGMVFLPKSMLKDVYELGAAVKEIRAGRKSGAEVEALAKRVMDSAAEWSGRVEEARDYEAGTLVCVAPF